MQPHEILEALTHRGYAPTLLYDDDGHWLVTDSGLTPIGDNVDDIYVTYVEENAKWYDNISEAVHAYLLETGEEIVKTKICDCCKQHIPLEDRFAEDDNPSIDFREPCNKCIHRETNLETLPCKFCIHL